MKIERRGLMLVLSSPSGAGKTTISRRLLESDPALTLSISVTTRQRRPGEVAGRDYIFVDPTEFNLMVNRGELLEHAKVFGNHYGTPRSAVEAALQSGKDVVFDIDWQGTQQLQESASADLVSIFLLPPGMAELERRLRSRAQDTEEAMMHRMSKAADEISHYAEYQYVLVNNDLDACTEKVREILRVERLRRHRQVGLTDFVKGLRDGV